MTVTILEGNCLETLKSVPAGSVQCSVTSPPYYALRDYGTGEWEGGDAECDHKPRGNGQDLSKSTLAGSKDTQNHQLEGYKGNVCRRCGAIRIDHQIGLESTPEAYVENLVAVFREVRRVLKDDGTLWLVLGDSYNGSGGPGSQYDNNLKGEFQKYDNPNRTVKGLKPKDLIGIPWRVAFALQADGWYLRSDIIWAKPNPMPESVTDRPTKSHEYIFLLSKSAQYYYDFEAILEPANFDGRKATRMKGSQKYQNGFAPTDENPNTLHVKGHERWSRQMPGIGPKHGAERKRGEEYKPMRGYKTKSQLEDMQHHGGSIQSSYGLSGNGSKGHSENLDAEGNPLGHEIDGIPARNKRDVWFVPTKPYKEAHFATYPVELIEPCILAGSKEGDTVLDPFNGSGTTGAAAIKHHRNYIGCELNPKYIRLTNRRLARVQLILL